MSNWRDRALDAWAPKIGPAAVRFLAAARELELDEGVGGVYQLDAWTRERLPETLAPRTDPTLRHWAIRRALLKGEFQTVRDIDAGLLAEARAAGRPDPAPRDLAGWLPVVEAKAIELQNEPFRGKALSRDDIADIILNSKGQVRSPGAMADWLVRLSRDAASDSADPVKDHKKQLDRVDFSCPPAL